MDFKVVKAQAINVKRLEWLDKLNYKRWSLTVYFKLTIAKVAYALNTPYPTDVSEGAELTHCQKKWIEINYCDDSISNELRI